MTSTVKHSILAGLALTACGFGDDLQGPGAARNAAELADLLASEFAVTAATEFVTPPSSGAVKLRFMITGTNLSDDSIIGTTGPVQPRRWLLRAYDTPARDGEPVWRSEVGAFGGDIELPLVIAPGESVLDVLEFFVATLTEQNVPTVAHFSAILQVGEPAVRSPEFAIGTVTLPASQ